MSVQNLVKTFNLIPHPEGGYYRETYRSHSKIQTCCLDQDFPATRNTSSAIYFMLQGENFSAFHRIKSDEIWHHYHGVTVDIHILKKDGSYECKKLGLFGGNAQPMQYVEKGDWFASSCGKPGVALLGCTVAPGFDFADFEMAQKDNLLKTYPKHREVIERFCRS